MPISYLQIVIDIQQGNEIDLNNDIYKRILKINKEHILILMEISIWGVD